MYEKYDDALVNALNPWLIDVEQLGISWWIMVGAVTMSLFTTLLSCCICCGLQSDKSKFRINVAKDCYEIVQLNNYDG